MKIIAIIPARYASTRFPAKVLADIDGKSMIERVYEQVKKTTAIDSVFIAVDNKIVFDKVIRFTSNVIMTSPKHPSGTDRIAEAARKLADKQVEFDFVINVQGDEPFIQPEQITTLADLLKNDSVEIATLVNPIKNTEKLFNANVVKAIFDNNQEAIYFSRNPIPFVRGEEQGNWLEKADFYAHIGMYAYRKDVLQTLTQLSPSRLEQAESLEQLRWLENGYKIQIGITHLESIGIDTPEDLERAKKIIISH